MSRVFLKLAMGVLLVFGATQLGGQSLPEWLAGDGAPKPPDFGIRDTNGFFNRDSAVPKRISERIRKLRADHGYQIYLVVEPVLIATNPQMLASTLQQVWLPEGDGVVIVFEANNRGLGFGLDMDASPAAKQGGLLIPTHETAAMLRYALAATDMQLAGETLVETLINQLADEVDRYFERRSAPPPPGRSLRLALLVIGALTLLGLAAILVGSLTRLESMAELRKFHFPQVDRPERLAAPCGGGNVVSRRFGAGASRNPQ